MDLVANQQLTSNGTVPSQTGSSSTNANGLTEGTEAMLQQNEPVITPEKRAITLLYGSETGNEDAEKWMANVINAIDTAPEGTQNEQIVSESIKSAKEKKF